MDEMRQHIENKDKAWLVSTLNSAGDAIMTCELDNRLDFANAEALKILGLNWSEILGKPFLDIFKVYRDGHEGPVQLWTGEQMDGVPDNMGLPRHSYYLKPDRSKCYLSARLSPLLSESGDIMGKVLVFRDISRIIAAEKNIKKDRNNLKMMFDLLPTSMLVIDAGHLINRVNQAFLKTFNLDEAQVIGKAFGDALGCVFGASGGCGYSLNCQFCHFRNTIIGVLEDKKLVRDKSIKVSFMNGSNEENRYLNVSVLPIITAKHSEYIITMEDITEQVY